MKTILFFVFALIVPISISAQDKEQVNLKEYFLDAEYFFAEESYVDALYDYLEIYNNGYKDNANINYRIGDLLFKYSGAERQVNKLSA